MITENHETPASSIIRQSDNWLKRYDVYILFIIITAYFVFLKIYQFASFNVGGEVADFETILWNTLHGRFLQMKCSSIPFFGEHFSPILLALVPLYGLFQSPYTLILIQAVACATAVIPLYYLIRLQTPQRWPPLAICLAFAISRTVNYGLMYDFHMEIFYPFLFFCAFLALFREHWLWFYLSLILAVSVKEDAFIATAGIGTFVFFSGYRKHGAITTVASMVGLITVVGFVIPFFRQGATSEGYRFIEYWSGYGTTKKEILLNFLNPVRQFKVLFTPEKLKQTFNLFSVFLFLPFFSSWRSVLFLILPGWFILYSSDNGMMNSVLIYYGLLIIPFFFTTTWMGVERISRFKPESSKKIIFWLTTAVFIVQLGNSRLFTQVFEDRYSIPERYKTTAHEIISAIPPGASTSVQINLISHIPPQECRTFFPRNLETSDFIFLDSLGNTWPLNEREYSILTDSVQHSQQWNTIIKKDGFSLLRRNP